MVPPYSHRVSRVRRYSGYSWLSSSFVYGAVTRYGAPSHALQLELNIPFAVQTPEALLSPVWPLPRSLATTSRISFDFFSSPYLDVSVQAVPYVYLFYSVYVDWTTPARLPHSEIPGYNACLQLPEAYRS